VFPGVQVFHVARIMKILTSVPWCAGVPYSQDHEDTH
jgi:hypothetical protein